MTDRTQPPDGPFPVLMAGDDLPTDDDELRALVGDLQQAVGDDALVSVVSDEDGDAWGYIETIEPDLIVVLMSAYRAALDRSRDLDADVRDNFDLEAYLVRLGEERMEADGTETPDDPMEPRYMIGYVLWFRPRVVRGVLAAVRELHELGERNKRRA